MVHNSHSHQNQSDLERQMTIARRVMDKDWITLRALALGDRYPHLDAAALVQMAEQERSKD